MAVPHDPVIEEVRKAAAKAAAEDAVGSAALAEPRPGPLKDVFAVVQDIQVHRWKVRPFYDVDFDFLGALSHPLAVMMKQTLGGEQSVKMDAALVRGEEAWDLAWIMTRSPDEVEDTLKAGGVPLLKQKARAEFSRLRLYGIGMLIEAVFKQVGIYWSPGIEYEEASAPKAGEEASGEVVAAASPSPFPVSDQPLTGSAG